MEKHVNSLLIEYEPVAPPVNSVRNKLLTLPLELRQEIYAYLLVQPDSIKTSKVWFTTAARHKRRLAKEGAVDCCGMEYGCTHYDKRLRPLTNILRTCRQISEEALHVLYCENIFELHFESRDYHRRFFTIGVENLRRIKHLRMDVWTRYYSYSIASPGEDQWLFFYGPDRYQDDEKYWVALMSQLATLEIILRVPTWGHHRGWPVWVGQLELTLKLIGSNVPDEADVSIEDNESMYVSDVVERCFPKGFKRVQTAWGDAYYKRETYQGVTTECSLSNPRIDS
ncbi:hypothetical protein F5B20DRAFT_523303 [Whalleya microplaca]|nr:hypothetical protein F5B20DRAFT_523303 [Whalleya microplaca]